MIEDKKDDESECDESNSASDDDDANSDTNVAVTEAVISAVASNDYDVRHTQQTDGSDGGLKLHIPALPISFQSPVILTLHTCMYSSQLTECRLTLDVIKICKHSSTSLS